MSKILLIDGTNNFIRNYAVIPTMDNHGEPNGGVFGFLRTLGMIIRNLSPDRVIIVWDGPGGSQKRKEIMKEYKAGRKPIRLNRNFDWEMVDVDKNKIKQRYRLAEYLANIPVQQVVVDNVEADDVIAYLVKYFDEDEKFIISNDKDFLQLVSDDTKIYKRGKEDWNLVGTKEVVEKWNIYPKNFALARAIVGDSSDNIKGINRIGMKTLMKLLPLFCEEEKVSLNQLFTVCEEEDKKDKTGKKYKRFLDAKELVINNLRMMQLSEPIIGPASIQKIKMSIGKEIRFNATTFRVKLMEDGITTLGDNFFNLFSYIYEKGKNDGTKV